MKDDLNDLLKLPDELEQLFEGMDPTTKETFRHAFADKVYQTTSTEAMQKHDEAMTFRFDAFIWQPGRSRLVIHDDDLLILKSVLGALIPLLGVGPKYAKYAKVGDVH